MKFVIFPPHAFLSSSRFQAAWMIFYRGRLVNVTSISDLVSYCLFFKANLAYEYLIIVAARKIAFSDTFVVWDWSVKTVAISRLASGSHFVPSPDFGSSDTSGINKFNRQVRHRALIEISRRFIYCHQNLHVCSKSIRHFYRVTLVVAYLSWVDFGLDVS